MNLCACGCGEPVKNIWKHNHWMRVENPSRSNAIKNIEKAAIVSAKKRKGKTRKEILGEEKANELSELFRNIMTGRQITWRDKISKTLQGRKMPQEIKDKISKSMKGHPSKVGDINPSKRPEVRDKLRIIRADQLKRANSTPNYNPDACVIFDVINDKFNLCGVHALNGGEKVILGYWLDYYDSKTNLCIEFDEISHFDRKTGELRKRDIVRQCKIVDFLQCKFLRIRYDDDIGTVFQKIEEILQK
jgi:hypothetical protein